MRSQNHFHLGSDIGPYFFFKYLQVLKEILNVLDGNSVDVTRAGSTASEYLDTSQIFFVCFGNFEERGFPHTSYGDKSENSTQKFNLSSNSPSATSDCGSNDSGNGSGEQRFNQTSRRDSQMSTDTRYDFFYGFQMSLIWLKIMCIS